MPSIVQRFNPLGGIDSDTEAKYVRDGNYLDAKNISHITQSTESTQSIIPVRGNELAYVIAPTATQNKTYRIFYSIDPAGVFVRTITVNRTDGTLFFQFDFFDQPTLDLTNTNLQAQMSAAAALASPAQTVTYSHTPGTNYTDVALNTVTGYEYTLLGDINTTVTQISEAWDVSLTGEGITIGSYDLLGDLFHWSTPQQNLPLSTSTSAVISNNGGLIRVTFPSAHGIVNGAAIRLFGSSIASVNGDWIAIVISPTVIDLGNSVFVAGGAVSLTLVTNPRGIGEIGVAQFDEDLDTWAYISLIKSKNLNFVTKKQVHTYAEKNSIVKSIYWTDDYNVPRVLYYYGDSYIANGFITFFNSDAIYSYDTIEPESRLMISASGASMAFTSQSQSGGGVSSGNWRYAFRFLTANFTATDISFLINPVNVYTPVTSAPPRSIGGDDAGVTTGKINNLTISNIPPNVFTYVELIGVNQIGDAIAAYNIKREVIPAGATSMMISHNGLEISTEAIDPGEINVEDLRYLTAKSIDVVDNRMVLSNLTSEEISDLDAWAQTFNHAILRTTIQGVGSPIVGMSFGEYLSPVNVYSRLGYMHNEVYRFGCRLRSRKTGAYTPVFWIDDISINTSATNVTTPNRRTAALASFDLTPNAVTSLDVYVAYVEFSNINLNFLVNGVPVKEIYDEIVFERAEIVPEVLATGAIIRVVKNGDGAGGVTYDFTGAGNHYGEYPYISGIVRTVAAATPVYPGAFVPDAAAGPTERFVKFYSPDVFCDDTSLSFLSGDRLLNFGAVELYTPYTPQNVFASTGATYRSSIMEYNGYTNRTTNTTMTIDAMTTFGTGQVESAFGGILFNQKLGDVPGAVGVYRWYNKNGYVIRMTTDITNVSANTDYGVYYGQYYRPIAYVAANPDVSKYGNRSSTVYKPTGTKYTITSLSPITIGTGVISVFGGDTFTQKFFLKHRFPSTEGSGGNPEGGGGIAFYSQNRANAQMIRRYANTLRPAWTYPNVDETTWLESTELGEVNEAPYNTGYDAVNEAQAHAAFDSLTRQAFDHPTLIIYSDLKVQESPSDGYRNYLPLNRKSLDLSFGEIVHHANGNGELLTWQPRKMMRQYFNTRGMLETSTNVEILIGDGGVMNRDGQTLTVIGSFHKWSIIKGKTVQGNDAFYWINTELKKAMRLGFDGTVSLADIRGMQSFFANNLTWVIDNDTPADGTGIHGVWDDRYAQAIWTVRGKRSVTPWNAIVPYVIGDVISYTPAVFSTFEETGEIYIALQNTTGNNPESSPLFWAVIPHTNNLYYNEYTLAFNEFKNKFTSFYTYLPKIYLKWADTYLAPKPVSDQGRIYLFNTGDYLSWWDGEQEERGYLEGIINQLPEETKWWEALRVVSEIVPIRYEFATETQVSFLGDTEFETREGIHDAPIKEDSTLTPLVNDGDTSLLYGRFLKAKMFFEIGVYQKLYNFLVKFRVSPRKANK